MPMTTTYDEEELLAGFGEPLRCECEHRDRHGGSNRCPEEATHRVVVVCAAVGCTDAAGSYLLCRACMRTWRRQAPSRRLRITPL